MTTTEEQASAPPSDFAHCKTLYEAMLAEAARVPDPEQPTEDNAGMIVYTGYLTKLVTQQLRFSVPYYTSLRHHLARMGCIKQLKRGGGSAPSEWLLIKEPTLADFLDDRPKRAPKQTREDM